MSGPRLALVLLQIAAGVGLATWLRRELSASSARQPLEELGTGLLLLIGAGAVVAAALRSRDR